MANGQQPEPPASEQASPNSPGATVPAVKVEPGRGPGSAEAGVVWILAVGFYLILFTLFVIYCMVKIWPVPTPSRENPPIAAASPTPSPTPGSTPTPGPTAAPTRTPSPAPLSGQILATPSPSPTASPSASEQPSAVRILGWQFDIWDEQRLLLLVILGGALGTLVHSMRSVYWYIGNRDFVKSWIPMYFMIPFAGGALALVFYLVVRGGFFSPQSSFQQTSPFGFTAFSALIGMFSTQAVLKLKEVAEVLLAKPLGGADDKPQESVNPAVPVAPAAPRAPETPGNKPPEGTQPGETQPPTKLP